MECEKIKALEWKLATVINENERFRVAGMCGLAGQNLNLKHYMNHWEGRALKAESELAAIDSVLGNRVALNGCKTRIEKIQRCIDAAVEGAFVKKELKALRERGRDEWIEKHRLVTEDFVKCENECEKLESQFSDLTKGLDEAKSLREEGHKQYRELVKEKIDGELGAVEVEEELCERLVKVEKLYKQYHKATKSCIKHLKGELRTEQALHDGCDEKLNSVQKEKGCTCLPKATDNFACYCGMGIGHCQVHCEL
jgi:DNA repair exonuclease SbcCD ATPase subunit